MATLREIRRAIADDMSSEGRELSDVLEFESMFDCKMREQDAQDFWDSPLHDATMVSAFVRRTRRTLVVS